MARTSFSELVARLGLSDEEALEIVGAEPLEAISGELDERVQVQVLGDLVAEACEQVGEAILRRWLRAQGPAGRPIELLLAHEYGAFERALAELVERGLILRGGGD